MAHTIVTTIVDRTDPRLGRHIEHDTRSRHYPVTAEPPRELTDIFWPDHAPVLDQGQIGGCVGWTGADILNTDWAKPVRDRVNKSNYFQNKDGLRFYELSTQADNIPGTYPPDDTGSSGLGLAKALKRLGYITGYQHAFTWDQLTAALAHSPVCIGSLWTNKMFSPDQDGVIHVGALNNSTIAGGHEWMLRGISYTKGLALGRNHWNTSWDARTAGLKLPGEFWLPLADLKKLLANQGDVTVLRI